jgi:mRNA-degrading endonuclease RelE of RelBE toxin-antitoxin system
MNWTVERTDAFLDALKVHRKNSELLQALDKKITRLKTDPRSVGGMLSGELHGWHSTRLIKNFRLLFKIDEHSKKVHLGAIDHRKEAY